MNYEKKENVLRSYFLIFIGTALMAFSIKSIYDPMHMVTGGFSGLAIVIKDVTMGIVDGGIPLWLTNTVLNIPLFVLGILIKGWDFTKKSVFGAMILSWWLYVIPAVTLIADGDYLLSAAFGGVLMGIGIGLIFMGQGTTGGTDMASALIQHYMRHYSIAQILQVVDGVIVFLGIWAFGINRALYAVIAIFITTKVADSFLEGMHFAKAAFIITDKEETVADEIMAHLDRGLTGIYSKGIYSGSDRMMLLCVVDKKEIVHLKEIVSETDPAAFVIVTDVREVLGYGFTRDKE